MNDPLGVMAIIAAQAAVGGAALTWLLGLWGQARRGFFLLMGVTVTLVAWGGYAAARAAFEPSEAVITVLPGDPSLLLLVTALLSTLSVGLLFARADRAGRRAGVASALVGVVALVPLAAARGTAVAAGVGEVVLGAAFLGATLYGLVLGHWYLFERALDNRHMIDAAKAYAVGCVAAAGSAALSATNPAPPLGGFSPFLAIPGFSVYLAFGLVAVCALIAGFTWKLATEGGRSIQAATGLMYLALIMAFSAEVSSKVRFFAGA